MIANSINEINNMYTMYSDFYLADIATGFITLIIAVIFLVMYIATFNRIGRITAAVTANNRHFLAPSDLDVTKEVRAVALVVATGGEKEKVEAAVRILAGMASEKCSWIARENRGKAFIERGEIKVWQYKEIYERLFSRRLEAQKEYIGHILAEYADQPRTNLIHT